MIEVGTLASINRHVEQQIEILRRFARALTDAGVEYRVVGGVAVFLHIEPVDPLAARLTRDVDVAVSRHDLDRIAEAVKPIGLVYRRVAAVNMLVDAVQPRARSAVHLVFVRERVRPTDVEPVPDFTSPVRTPDGILLAPVAELVKMKLTSFREKDRVHVRDLDGVGLITSEVEAGLPEELRRRLTVVRSSE